MPCLRLAKGALVDMDQRIRGLLGDADQDRAHRNGKPEATRRRSPIRVRHKPFSVYMKFITPQAGPARSLYVENQNDGKLVAMGSGWKRRFGKIKLDPERHDGHERTSGTRSPRCGIYNLTDELIQIAEQDVKYGECTVRHRYREASTAARPR